MGKVKLTKTELAVLDALITSFEDDGKLQSQGAENLAFITAVARVTVAATRVTVKATPYVVDAATALVGGTATSTEKLNELMGGQKNIDLKTLIKLREEASK